MRTNDALTHIRALAPDLMAILATIGPIDDDADPVVTDYLDAHCPGWGGRAGWLQVLCGGCAQPVIRPVRETADFQNDAQISLVEKGRFILCRDLMPKMSGWIKGEPDDLCVAFEDAAMIVCEDTGCCGHAGNPGNTRCLCGHVVGTIHTDCCGPSFFWISARQVQLVWGLPLPTDAERALIAALAALPADAARRRLRCLPLPLSPALDAALTEIHGREGQICVEPLHKGVERGWRVDWYDDGRWTRYDADGALIGVEIRRDHPGVAGGPQTPSALLALNRLGARAELIWSYGGSARVSWALNPLETQAAFAHFQGLMEPQATSSFLSALLSRADGPPFPATAADLAALL